MTIFGVCMRGTILIVEDNQLLRDSLTYNLRKQGYTVLSAASGEEGVERARREKPELMIIDIGLPGMDGLEVCRVVQAQSKTPVIFLTARGEETDRIVGLEIGADDYVSKPFSMGELLARVRAVLRRTRALAAGLLTAEVIQAGDITIDQPTHQVAIGGKPVALPPKGYELLRLLAANAGRVVDRQAILDAVWGEDFFGDPKTLDVHIHWLRQKIEPDPHEPQYILTVRGVGYRFASVKDGA